MTNKLKQIINDDTLFTKITVFLVVVVAPIAFKLEELAR